MKIFLSFIALVLCSITGCATGDDWWENGHFFQIYPRSYKDGDGDGIGDLKGIIENLAYLKTISVAGVWLSPIFKSPMKDMGYDISDFRDIDPVFGTLEDFDRLIAHAKELDIKIILDFVPNHSSDQHEWFKASSDPSHADHQKYKDFYVWNKGKQLENGTIVAPNNWLSVFRGSAWTWVESRKAYYYHQFLPAQPDLNFRNRAVIDEMNEVLRYWLRKGVAGFRIDAVPHFYESKENADGVLDDEPLSGGCEPEEYCYLNHIYTTDLNETFDLVYEFRSVVDETEFSNQTRILMGEAYSKLHVALKYYGRVENGKIVKYGAHIPFNFEMMSNTWMGTGSYGFIESINNWVLNLPKGKAIHPNWVLGNHDGSRLATRYKPSRIDLFSILLKTLPGITVTYYGEEIGMTDVRTSSGDSRELARTPMQWNSSPNAGFSNVTAWLPVAENFTKCNVELETNQKPSHLNVVRQIMELRENPTMKYGGLKLNAVDEELFVYKREIADQPDADIVVVVLNLGLNKKNVNLNDYLDNLPKELKVVTASIHAKETRLPIIPRRVIDSSKVIVSPEAGIVFIGRN